MLIESQNQFDRLFYELKEQDLLAIDLEFIRRRSFYAKPALMQIAYGKNKVAVIDLLEIDISAFKGIWQSKKINKILHGAEQDVEILFNLMGVYPESLFDSQIALQFLTHDDSVSYQSLISLLFDQYLDKTMQTTNWLKRPLEKKAIEYAKNDVLWLYLCFEKLNRGLKQFNRFNWFGQEMNDLLDTWKIRFDSEQYYKSINHYHKLEPEYQKLLKKICIQRENLVKKLDLPRTWVCKDTVLLRLIKFQPQNNNKFNEVLKKDSSHREFAKLAIDFFNQSDNQIKKPLRIKRNHLSNEDKEKINQLKEKILAKSKQECLHSNLVLRMQDLQLLVKNNPSNFYQQTWRKEWMQMHQIYPISIKG